MGVEEIAPLLASNDDSAAIPDVESKLSPQIHFIWCSQSWLEPCV